MQKKTAKITGTRRLTICNKSVARQSGIRYISLPIISLSGRWLQRNGFKSGQVIDITCTRGRLVITIAKEQKFKLL